MGINKFILAIILAFFSASICEGRVVANGGVKYEKYIVKDSQYPRTYYWYTGLSFGDTFEARTAIIINDNKMLIYMKDKKGVKHLNYEINEDGDLAVKYADRDHYLERGNINYVMFTKTMSDYKRNAKGRKIAP